MYTILIIDQSFRGRVYIRVTDNTRGVSEIELP